ncbi:hypothetical protein GCM10009127_24030 [Alteraurantiacibacter aestuarii]|uniref:DUF2939 domain-containing protein n=1 Tax=Alteraurantiacibacter aestuarii TaxID=650004 RepID=UPI0031DE0DCA
MKKFLAILVLAASLAGTWYFVSPWMAMRGIVNAARDGDVAALEQRIDFARLREDTGNQLQGAIAERTQDGGLLERVGGAVAGEIAGRLTDVALTPRGIANLVTVGAFTVPLVPERFRGQELEWDVERTGFSTFDAVSTWEDGSAGPVLVFERDGIDWDLVGVRMRGSR